MRDLALILLLALAAGCGTQPFSNENGAHSSNVTAGHNAVNSGSSHSNMVEANSAAGYSMESSPGAPSAPYELQFIDSMMAHHQEAIQMAELAETRALHPEIKEMAANVISEQERENAKMSEWRDQWFEGKGPAINTELPGMHDGMSNMNIDKLRSIKGNDFDLEFLRQMIPHHEGAVRMARDAQAKADNTEIKELAADIVTAQSEEIGQMRGWLADWGRK